MRKRQSIILGKDPDSLRKSFGFQVHVEADRLAGTPKKRLRALSKRGSAVTRMAAIRQLCDRWTRLDTADREFVVGRVREYIDGDDYEPRSTACSLLYSTKIEWPAALTGGLGDRLLAIAEAPGASAGGRNAAMGGLSTIIKVASPEDALRWLSRVARFAHDEDPYVRLEAARCLGRVSGGRAVPTAYTEIAPFLPEANSMVRVAALTGRSRLATLLGTEQQQETSALLLSLARHPDELQRSSAVHGLGVMARDGADAIRAACFEALLRFVADLNPASMALLDTVAVLGKSPADQAGRALEALRPLLNRGDESVRAWSLASMASLAGRMGADKQAEVYEVITRWAQTGDDGNRARVMSALGALARGAVEPTKSRCYVELLRQGADGGELTRGWAQHQLRESRDQAPAALAPAVSKAVDGYFGRDPD